MIEFTYVGVTRAGNKIEGKRSANDKNELLGYLNSQGFTVISIRENYGKQFKQIFNRDIGGLPLSEKVLIAKQLSTMISAGLPIIQAMGIILDQQTKPGLKTKFQEIYKKLESGISLSEAFRTADGIFSDVQLNLISAGEKSGNLNEMLLKVSEDLEKSKGLRGKIVGAMIYPAVIFVVLIIVVVVMIVFMVPQVQSLYESFGQKDLPLVTRILVRISEFFASPIFLITFPTLIISSFYAYRSYYKDPKHKVIVDSFKLKIPVFGKLITKINLSEFCRVTSMLIKSGVPIIESIGIVSNAMSNHVFKKIINDAKEDVAKGSAMYLALAKNNTKNGFPEILIKIIATGEESGKLDKVLDDMYKYYNGEVEQITANLTKLLEPFILVLVGGMVAFLAVAIYLPIYQIGNAPGLQ